MKTRIGFEWAFKKRAAPGCRVAAVLQTNQQSPASIVSRLTSTMVSNTVSKTLVLCAAVISYSFDKICTKSAFVTVSLSAPLLLLLHRCVAGRTLTRGDGAGPEQSMLRAARFNGMARRDDSIVSCVCWYADVMWRRRRQGRCNQGREGRGLGSRGCTQ